MIEYKCSCCGASGVKLWRQYVHCATAVDLLCAKCAIKDQGAKFTLEDMTPSGQSFREDVRSMTFGIENLLPAIPTADMETYWHSSIPEDRQNWWKSLPLEEPKRKRFFDKSDNYTDLESELENKFEAAIKPIVEEYSDKGYSIRDLVSCAIRSVSLLESEMILTKNLKKAKEDRHKSNISEGLKIAAQTAREKLPDLHAVLQNASEKALEVPTLSDMGVDKSGST